MSNKSIINWKGVSIVALILSIMSLVLFQGLAEQVADLAIKSCLIN